MNKYISKNKFKTILFIFFPQVFNSIVGLVFSILIARFLGPDGLGFYTLIVTIIIIGTLFTDIGLGKIVLKELSIFIHSKNNIEHFKILTWYTRIREKLTLAVAMVISLVLFYRYESQYLNWEYYIIIFVGILSSCYLSIEFVKFQSESNYRHTALISSASSLTITIIFLFLYIFNIITKKNLIYGYILSLIIPAILYLYSIKQKKTTLKENEYLDIYKKWKNVWFSNTISIATEKLDVIVISYFYTLNDIGIYSIAMKYVLPLMLFNQSIATYLWPSISKSPIVFFDNLNKYKYILFLLLFLLIFYCLFFPFTTTFLFGENFIKSEKIAQILCIRFLLIIISSPFVIFLYSTRYLELLKYISIIQLSIYLIMIILFKNFGVISIALGFLLQEAFGVLFTLIYYFFYHHNEKNQI